MFQILFIDPFTTLLNNKFQKGKRDKTVKLKLNL